MSLVVETKQLKAWGVSRDIRFIAHKLRSATVQTRTEPVVSKDQRRRVSIADTLDRLTSFSGSLVLFLFTKYKL
jgi:hypothetical protein